jgi:hypothetical protein
MDRFFSFEPAFPAHLITLPLRGLHSCVLIFFLYFPNFAKINVGYKVLKNYTTARHLNGGGSNSHFKRRLGTEPTFKAVASNSKSLSNNR